MIHARYINCKITVQALVMSFLLGLSAVVHAAADRGQAMQAQTQGDFNNAAKLWLQLANEGDPVAAFNLALLYKRGSGVMQDGNLAQYWLQMAARKGLVGAYHLVNSKAMLPGNDSVAKRPVVGPQEWVAMQKPSYYTLQLASSTNQALIQKYYSENNLQDKAGYYRSKRSGEDWYALVYGAYPTVQDAKEAIYNLPEGLKKWSPWVRNIKSIHRIMVR